MPTYTGKYSESEFGDDKADQIRDCAIGPMDMGSVKNLSDKWLNANSDFSRKLIPTAGTKQDSARLDVVVPVEARFIDGELPKGQRRGKTFKWS
jgi:hypothetical protein